MYLITAATPFEMKPFREKCIREGAAEVITGVGPVETAVRLTKYLNGFGGELKGVVNFGVAGAYFDPDGQPRASLLDICVAETEVFGDLGVCLGQRIEPIAGHELEPPITFTLDKELRERATQILEKKQIPFRCGNFVTVNCASGTAERGNMLARQHAGLCENMEGAAVARVCQEFGLPCLEVRCVSNLVENRDTGRWKLKQACRGAGEAVAAIINHFAE